MEIVTYQQGQVYLIIKTDKWKRTGQKIRIVELDYIGKYCGKCVLPL
jgi:hypothetical protein